jgi:pimeloyl-ACP methyl ester carboxylesterase
MFAGAGTELFASETGDGPLLVLLHGIGSSGASWLPVARSLAGKYHLVTLDLRGHGKSAHPETGYLLEDYAADLEAVLSTIAERPRILAHSLGALVTVTWAKRHPDRAIGILLEDMPMHLNHRESHRLDEWAELASRTAAEIEAQYRADHPEWAEEDYARRAEVMKSSSVAAFTELRDRSRTGNGIDMLEGIEDIQSPIRLLFGDVELGSRVTPEKAAAFALAGPNFSAVHIPGASHSIHRDSTEPFLKEAFAFLNGLT